MKSALLCALLGLGIGICISCFARWLDSMLPHRPHPCFSSSRSSQPCVDERKTRAIAATSSGAAKQCARVLFSSGTSFYPKLTSGEPGLTASVFPAAILTSSGVGSNVRSRAAGIAVIHCIAHLKSAWRVLLTGSSRGFVSGGAA